MKHKPRDACCNEYSMIAMTCIPQQVVGIIRGMVTSRVLLLLPLLILIVLAVQALQAMHMFEAREVAAELPESEA